MAEGVSGNGCGCGCGEMKVVTHAGEACGCGCECCADDRPKTPEQEIAELTALRESIDRRLQELAS
ncbi:MAG: hypothetical protein M3314_05430 [Actinomycetota bacterium]|jgi:hypothetical protein|nr:hypothetical protein [Actinomycetota bacterium]